MIRYISLASILIASTAQADIEITFRDGAPKDRFTITNLSDCATDEVRLTIDLITSQAGVIFDVDEGGAGVEVFQPIEIVQGAELVTFVSDVQDGSNSITLVMSGLSEGGSVAFTADIDDSAGEREITVSGSELAGAYAVIDDGVSLLEGAFDDTGRAVVPLGACVS